ncbi:biotin/lipoyl-binding carrier protein [Pimelobacter simplex]|uniref:Biotin carboxyl carrier protein n=1 Tax=Nocardioides simplex TaxID=2045 RepID=A0A0A1DV75_NOCSI|nr:biotin/lipoyl-binding carrier protein [Pimelobacter simplex]AIY19335.1 Biotin carboxyl carrier protein [Pimelobacter simplex]MCG8149453.1 biotin/lipoyl-binding carrier protein [Pimelobacter simplex]GEB16175.1 acetyl-CoA carboxylase biotin carboxyl carrier protein subunit [Pimelobacter simplex]SFM18877.1 Biotin-requiring enzyme [Pimelobacter simplex]
MARVTTSELVAEMVANVLHVEVAEGASVAVGDTVVLLESMKMEIPVMAEVAGVVTAVKVDVGDVVQEGDVLIELRLA